VKHSKGSGGDPPPPTPPSSTAERLLEAAAAEFAQRGYDGTKIHHIVKRAGLTTGAVYRQFKNKTSLLRAAVVSRAATRWLDTEQRGPRQTIADFLVGAGSFDQAMTESMAMVLEAYVAARRIPEVAEAVAESQSVWFDSVQPLIEQGVRDGSIDPSLDPRTVAVFLRLVGLGALLYRAARLPAPDSEHWRHLLSRLVRALAPDQPTA